MSYFFKTSIASLKVVVSGTEGPDAMESNLSPTTSEIIIEINVALLALYNF